MKNAKKRLLSMLMAITMVVSLIQSPGFGLVKAQADPDPTGMSLKQNVYYDFKSYADYSYEKGKQKQFMYLAKGIEPPALGKCVLNVPNNSAILEIVGDSEDGEENNSTHYNSKKAADEGYEFVCYVKVVQAGSGFDSCKKGGIYKKEGRYYYCCSGGGVALGKNSGTPFTYTYKDLTSDMLSAELADGSSAASKDRYENSDFNIKCTPGDGNTYELTDYQFVDGTVDGHGDNRVDVKFGKVNAGILVDGSSAKLTFVTGDCFAMSPKNGSSVRLFNVLYNKVRVTVKDEYKAYIDEDNIVTKYYDSEGTLIKDSADNPIAPTEVGTYTVKIDFNGQALRFEDETDFYIGTYTITGIEKSTHDFDNGVVAWSRDYKTATLTLTCQDPECGYKQVLTNESVVVDEKTTATCNVVGNVQYKVVFGGSADGGYIDDYTSDSKNPKTANGETYEIYKDVTGLKPHVLVKKERKAATCTETGSIEHYECSACHSLFRDKDAAEEITSDDTVIPKINHANVEKIDAVPQTCAENGSVEFYYCPDCEKSFKDATCKTPIKNKEKVIPAAEHKLVYFGGYEANCVAEGRLRYAYCSACKNMYTYQYKNKSTDDVVDVIPSGASKDDYVVVVKDRIYSTTIPANKHTLGFHAYVEPKCYAPGAKAYWECDKCGLKFLASESLQTTSPDDAAKEADKDALATSLDSLSSFEEDKVLTIPEVEHVYDQDSGVRIEGEDVPETCTSNYKKQYEYACTNSGCSNTKKEYTEIPDTALGHDYEKPVFRWSADYTTCKAEFKCKRAGCVNNDTPIVLTANIESDTVTDCGTAKKIEKTLDHYCLKEGTTTYTAVFMPTNYNVNPSLQKTYTATDIHHVAATGHNLVYVNGSNETCESDGAKAYWKCVASGCGMCFAASSIDLDDANQAVEKESLKFANTDADAYINLIDSSIEKWANIPAKTHSYGAPKYDWAEDGKTCKITYTCANDDSHVLTVNASTEPEDGEAKIESEELIAATCTSKGITKYIVDGAVEVQKAEYAYYTYNDSKTVVDIDSLGHQYKLVNKEGKEDFDWAVDEATGDVIATASFICSRNDEHKATHEVSVTSEVTTPATCTTDGVRTYTGLVTFNKQKYTKTITEVIPALGHDYTAPVFTWGKDNKSAVATITCKNDSKHVVSEKAVVTSVVDKAETCEEDGTTTYTAKATLLGKEYTAIKTVDDINAKNHDYEVTFEWNPDGKSAFARRVCKNDPKHYDLAIATVTPEVKVEATCKEDGTTLYTAVAEFDKEKYTDTKEIVDIKKLGHDFGDVEFGWTEGGKVALAKRVCSHDSNHVELANATVTSEVSKKATCEAKGTTKYTAKVEFDGEESSESLEVEDIEATGHKLGDWVVTLEPTATTPGEKVKKCANCDYTKKKEIPATGKPSTDEKEETALELNDSLKASQTGNKITVSWGKVPAATEYRVYVQYCGDSLASKATKTIKNNSTTSVDITKLNGKALDLKKNYKLNVEAYGTLNGKKVLIGKTITAHIVGSKNAKYTNVKNLSVSKTSYVMTSGQTEQIKASTTLVNKDKKPLDDKHAKEFRYATSNKKIATVSKSGVITAKKAGACYVYVYARNGYAKKIKVTVK